MSGAEQPARWDLRLLIENRAEPSKTAKTLQTLRMIKNSLRRLRQGCPLERHRGGQRSVRGDSVRISSELLDLRTFNPQRKPELPTVCKIPPSEGCQRCMGPCVGMGHGWASERRLVRSVWVYRTLDSGQRCPSRPLISGKVAPRA